MTSLPNDLVVIVALHATTKVTLSLLTSYAPLAVYDASHWRQKTLLETRGLVVNDDVVPRPEAEGWYAYYLVRNRTYWGDVIRSNHNATKITIVRTGIMFQGVVRSAPSHNRVVTVSQDHALTLTISGRCYDVRGKVKGALRDGERVLVLDEYGDVWGCHEGRGRVMAVVTGEHVVSMHRTDSV